MLQGIINGTVGIFNTTNTIMRIEELFYCRIHFYPLKREEGGRIWYNYHFTLIRVGMWRAFGIRKNFVDSIDLDSP